MLNITILMIMIVIVISGRGRAAAEGAVGGAGPADLAPDVAEPEYNIM